MTSEQINLLLNNHYSPQLVSKDPSKDAYVYKKDIYQSGIQSYAIYITCEYVCTDLHRRACADLILPDTSRIKVYREIEFLEENMHFRKVEEFFASIFSQLNCLQESKNQGK